MTKLLSILFVAAFGFAAMLPGQATEMGMMSTAKPAGQMAHAEGVIKALDAKAGMVTLAHGPVPELKWPAMTMAFKLAKPEQANERYMMLNKRHSHCMEPCGPPQPHSE